MKSIKPWHVYMLRLKDNSLYTGATTDVQRRLFEHQKTKKASKYVRSRLPCKLVFVIETKNRSDAQKFEAAIKKLSKKEKEEIVLACSIITELKLKLILVDK